MEDAAAAVADATAEEVDDAFAFFFGAGAAMAREKRTLETMMESFITTDLVYLVLVSLEGRI